MKTFQSEFSAEPTTQLKMMHFEAECEFALLKGYDHIRDWDNRLFKLIDKVEGIDVVEIDEPSETPKVDEPVEECSFCQALSNIDDMLLECTTEHMRLNSDNLVKLEKLAYIKRILLECL